MFYTSLKFMKDYYKKVARKNGMSANNLDEFLQWKKETKAKLSQLLAMDKLVKAPANPQLLEEDVYKGFRRQKVLIQTLPEVYMPVYILFPNKDNDNGKVFLTPAGHGGGGIVAVMGDETNPLVAAKIESFNYAYGLELVKRGCTVICPETIGFGERREELNQRDDEILGCSCYGISHMAESMGMTLAGIQTFELMCLLDYLEEREDIDISDISALGFSGGGMQVLWLSAFDERVKKMIISGYLYGYEEAHLERYGNCNCNYVPHLWEYYDMGDVASLLAPRKLFVQSGDKDHLNGKRGVVNVTEQLDIVRKAYSFYGAEDMIRHDVFEGPHRWYGQKLDDYIG